MADKGVLRAPAGLGRAGKALWGRVTAAFEDFDPVRLAVLGLAAHQADDIARLEEVIAAQGMSVPGASGQPRLNAAVTEVRQGRIALGKLLDQLALPDEAEKPMTQASRRAKHAADVRWAERRALKERQLGGGRGSA